MKRQRAIEYIIPAIHFLLTFLWERTLFVFTGNRDFWDTPAMNSSVSDKSELIIIYIASKVCAGIIIWLLWKCLFFIKKQRLSHPSFKLFYKIYFIGLIAGLFSYPTAFALEIDNYTIFSMAIRFLPQYWQSIYTGILYAGCMMAIPHPLSIYVFQWTTYMAVVAYIYFGVEKWYEGKCKYAALLFLLLPETWYLLLIPYRNNWYTILCLFYFAYLFFSSQKEEKVFSLKEMLMAACLSAFLMVWRSEGIFIGAGGMLFLFLFSYKAAWKKRVLVIALFCGSFLLFHKLQGIGAEKYYGKDYMILNTTGVLRSILNDPNVNLEYKGALEDLAAIEAVVPVQVLKEQGLTGYRNYNYTQGRTDFNQTMANTDDARAYMAAYYRIVAHNVLDYLSVQMNSFFHALSINLSPAIYTYTGEPSVKLESFVYNKWQVGFGELRQTPFTAEWENSQFRIAVWTAITWLSAIWRRLWIILKIDVLMRICAVFADFGIVLVEFVRFLREKSSKHLVFVLLMLIILSEMAAVFLFMPMGRETYLYPVLYVSYLLIYMYIINLETGQVLRLFKKHRKA